MSKLKPGKLLLLSWLVWRVALIAVGLLAGRWLAYKPSFPYFDSLLPIFGWPQWLYSWGGFDGVHYLGLAKNGYVGTGLVQAFFPVWPGLMAGLQSLTGLDLLLSGLILSSIFSFSALWLLFQAWKLQMGDKLAHWSLIWWLVFPTSFFLLGIYNEGLFLSLAVGSYLAAKQKNWWLAGGLAAIASATRVVGIWLVPMLWLMAIDEGFSWSGASAWLRKNWLIILAGGLGALGLLSYMAYLWWEFQDPLFFLHQQSAFGAGRQESLIIWPQVVWRSAKILMTARPFDFKYFAYVQEFIVGVGSVWLLMWGWWQRRATKITPALLVYSLGCVVMPTLTGTFSSLPRYVLAAWPLWQILAVWSVKHPGLARLGLAFSLILLIINTALFIQGYWVA